MKTRILICTLVASVMFILDYCNLINLVSHNQTILESVKLTGIAAMILLGTYRIIIAFRISIYSKRRELDKSAESLFNGFFLIVIVVTCAMIELLTLLTLSVFSEPLPYFSISQLLVDVPIEVLLIRKSITAFIIASAIAFGDIAIALIKKQPLIKNKSKGATL